MKIYYNIDCPTYGEVVLEDKLRFFVQPLSRNGNIDIVKKHGYKAYFHTKEELLEWNSEYNNSKIEWYKKQAEWHKDRISFINKLGKTTTVDLKQHSLEEKKIEG